VLFFGADSLSAWIVAVGAGIAIVRQIALTVQDVMRLVGRVRITRDNRRMLRRIARTLK